MMTSMPNPELTPINVEALLAQLEREAELYADDPDPWGGANLVTPCGHTIKDCRDVWPSGGRCCIACAHGYS